MLLPEKTIDYEPDTIIALPYSDTLPMMFPEEGVYFCSVERDSEEGYTFFNFGETFPSMTDPADNDRASCISCFRGGNELRCALLPDLR